MKNLKKLASLLLAFVLAMSMTMTAFAAETDGFTIKLTGTTESPTTGHTYEVYQIFTGDLHEGVLSNVKYGKSYGTEGEEVNATVLEAITDAEAFAKSLVDGEELGDKYGDLNEADGWKLEDVPAGYYLIVDKTLDLPMYHTRSAYIVQVVDDVDMAPKSGTVDIVKKVKDVNDTTGATTDWQDSADYDIGDTIPYQITVNVNDIAEFEDYEIIITDTMSKGLTYNQDVEIEMAYTVVGATEDQTKDVTNNFIMTGVAYAGNEEKYADGMVYTFTCQNIKALVPEGSNLMDATFVLSYTCTLDTDAVLGLAGNPNKVNLEYDREPYKDGKGKTPDDVNIVFTYKVNVDKVAEGNETGADGKPVLKPLTGAEFTLYKEVAADSDTQSGKDIKDALKANNPSIKADALDDEKFYIIIEKTEAESDEDTFGFKGVDDGTYVLVETTIPDGYNAWDAVGFTISATHDTEADDPELKTLTGGELVSGEFKDTGIIETDIENKSGTELPSTGGMGTTMFYVVGAILAIGAAVILVTKKRMNEN